MFSGSPRNQQSTYFLARTMPIDSINGKSHYRSIYFEAGAWIMQFPAYRIVLISLGFKFIKYKNLEDLLVKAANKQDYSTKLKEVLTLHGDYFDESASHTASNF